MSRLPTSEARRDLASVVNRVAYGEERIVLHRRGKDVVAIISMDDLELLERLEDRMDLRAARRAQREAARKGTRPLAEVVDELGDER